MNYLTDGREAALGSLAEILNDLAPVEEPTDFRYANPKLREQLLKDNVKMFGEKARLPLQWRETITQRSGIHPDEVLKATNTIVEIIEKTLVKGDKVHIRGLGNFSVRKGRKNRCASFKMSDDWEDEINDVWKPDDLGLRRKVNGGRFLERGDAV